MKRVQKVLLLLALAGIVGCASGRVDIASLDDRDGVYWKGAKTPFTGKAFHVRKDGWTSEYSIRNGKLNGPLLEWDENGNLLYCTDYLDGKKHGYYRGWWTNGLRAIQVEYVQDQYHGDCKTWWENGQIKTSGGNDEKSGPSLYWDENGKKITLEELNDLMEHRWCTDACPWKKAREPKSDGDGLKPAP